VRADTLAAVELKAVLVGSANNSATENTEYTEGNPMGTCGSNLAGKLTMIDWTRLPASSL